jgi:dTDP-4-amino-4,6-dideoxygalactose transaminase
MHLTLECLNLKPDDEIITTPYTMAATIEAILHAGAKPVFADIEPTSMNIDPVQVEARLTGKTKAIVSVDIAGCPADYGRLTGIARSNDLFLIDDAAHSLGAKYKGKPIGAIADATVFSFYSTKNITTGEGGMVVSNSEKLIERIRHLSLHGMTSSGWKRHEGGNWEYDIIDLGYKYNLSDLSAALGLGQLCRFDELQDKRRKLAMRYIERLSELNRLLEMPRCDADSEHAWHLFIVKMVLENWNIDRNRLIDELEKRGVGCGVHFIPVYRFTYFKKIISQERTDFQNCERAFARVISLPLYADLSFDEVDYVCQTLEALTAEYGT